MITMFVGLLGQLRLASVNITSPTSSSSWQVGTTQNITWSASIISGQQAIDDFTLQLFSGSSYSSSIATGISSSTRSYSWTIPNTVGTQMRVKIIMNYRLIE